MVVLLCGKSIKAYSLIPAHRRTPIIRWIHLIEKPFFAQPFALQLHTSPSTSIEYEYPREPAGMYPGGLNDVSDVTVTIRQDLAVRSFVRSFVYTEKVLHPLWW